MLILIVTNPISIIVLTNCIHIMFTVLYWQYLLYIVHCICKVGFKYMYFIVIVIVYPLIQVIVIVIVVAIVMVIAILILKS